MTGKVYLWARSKNRLGFLETCSHIKAYLTLLHYLYTDRHNRALCTATFMNEANLPIQFWQVFYVLRPLLAPRDRAPTRFLTTYTIPSAKLCFKSSFTSTISHMNHRNTADMFTGSFAMTLKLHQFACCETGHSSSNGRASCRAFTGWLYVMKSHSTPQIIHQRWKAAITWILRWVIWLAGWLSRTTF